jgi:hypothetical protein
MAVGFPVKDDYATGDVLTAANMNDLAGTLNIVPTFSPNLIINGSLDHWQRGTSFSAVTSYTADRWQLYGVNPERFVSRQTGAPDEFTYCARVGRSVGSSSVNNIPLGTTFETAQVVNLRNQFLTLSFYARKGADYSIASSGLSAVVLSGTGTDGNLNSGLTGSTAFINGSPILTTSWQKFTFTSSAALGTNIGQLGVRFQMTPVGTAGAADYFEVAGVQLEVGKTATTWKRAGGGTIQGELAACQRYYTRLNYPDNSVICGGQAFSATGCYGTIVALPVTMRTVPSGAVSGASHFKVTNASAGAFLASSAAALSFTQTGFAFNSMTVATGLLAGNATTVFSNNASCFVEIGAEL